MKKSLTNSIKLMALALGLVFIGSLALRAEAPAPAEHLNAKVGKHQNPNVVSLDWRHDLSPKEITFDIYIAEEFTKDFSKFEIHSQDSFFYNYVNEGGRKFFVYNFLTILAEGEYSFYVITKDYHGNVSEPSNIAYVKVHGKTTTVSIESVFTTLPAKVDEEWTHQIKLIGKIDDVDVSELDLDVEYQITYGPEGATINKKTGLISWTPTESGDFYFAIEAEIDGYEEISLQGKRRVRVRECDVPSTITVNINNEEGKPVKEGVAWLLKVNEKPQTPKDSLHNLSTARFVNGIVQFEDVDAGTYYLEIQASGYHPRFYENGNGIWDATPITIDCDKDIELSLTLEVKPIPKKYNVSGVILDEETNEPIKNTQISFYGTDNFGKQHLFAMIRTENSSDGKYSINLSENIRFTVMASGFEFDGNDSTKLNQYETEFYDDVTDASEATVIELTEDKTGVDFYLKKLPVFENSISGTVYDWDTKEIIPNVSVIAFLVSTDDWYKKHMYIGRATYTDEDGNFEISGLVPGEYVIMTHFRGKEYMQGYYVENDKAAMHWQDGTKITVEEDSEITGIDINLEKIKGMVGKGRVKGRVDRRKELVPIDKYADEVQAETSITGANIFVLDKDGKKLTATTTNENGDYNLSGLANGEYKLFADRVGYYSYENSFTIDDEHEVITKDLELDSKFASSVTEVTPTVNQNTVYPNPARDAATVEFFAVEGMVTIKVINAAGLPVLSNNVYAATGYNAYDLDLSSYPVGAYYVQISSDELDLTLPLMLSR